MRIDNSISCGYNLSRKRGTPIDGAPSYTKLSEKITAKFGRLGGYFFLKSPFTLPTACFPDVANAEIIWNKSENVTYIASPSLLLKREG